MSKTDILREIFDKERLYLSHLDKINDEEINVLHEYLTSDKPHDELLETNKYNSHFYFILAIYNDISKAKRELCKKFLRKSIDINNNPYACYYLGFIYYEEKNSVLAEEYLMKGLAVDDDYVNRVYLILIKYYRYLKKNDAKANKYWEKYVDICTDWRSAKKLAAHYKSEEMIDSAIKYYFVAIERGYILGYHYIAELYEEKSDFDLAYYYYDISSKNGIITSMLKMGYSQAEHEKNFVLAAEYYLMCINYNINDYPESSRKQLEKNYNERDILIAKLNLGSLYSKWLNNPKLGKKYYLEVIHSDITGENGRAYWAFGINYYGRYKKNHDKNVKYQLIGAKVGYYSSMIELLEICMFNHDSGMVKYAEMAQCYKCNQTTQIVQLFCHPDHKICLNCLSKHYYSNLKTAKCSVCDKYLTNGYDHTR